MKRKFLHPFLVLIALLFLTGGCSKYDEGPMFSLYSKEKRLQGRWYFSRVVYNDADSTDSYRLDPVHAIEFILNPERDENWSAYTWNHNMGASTNRVSLVEYGYWRLTENLDSLRMVTTVRITQGQDPVADTTEYKWKINRLAYSELYLERVLDDTTKLVWQLWKRVY